MFAISKMVISSGLRNQSQSTVNMKKINIIVGPNNSGKSTVLMDIENWLDHESHHTKLLRDMKISFSPDIEEYREFEKDILEFEDGDRILTGGKELIPLVKKHLFRSSTRDIVDGVIRHTMVGIEAIEHLIKD